jgi:hypothetical protein
MLTLFTGQAYLADVYNLAAVMQISDKLGDLGIKNVTLDKKIGSKDQVQSVIDGWVQTCPELALPAGSTQTCIAQQLDHEFYPKAFVPSERQEMRTIGFIDGLEGSIVGWP